MESVGHRDTEEAHAHAKRTPYGVLLAPSGHIHSSVPPTDDRSDDGESERS